MENYEHQISNEEIEEEEIPYQQYFYYGCRRICAVVQVRLNLKR